MVATMHIDELTRLVIQCAYLVHNALGVGFVEKVYENAMVLELRAHGLEVEQQKSLSVRYRSVVIGDFQADLVVEGRLIVELKAVMVLSPEHEVQLVNYLTATGIEDGLLINFGKSVEVKRKYRTYRPKHNTQA